ncbi:hypothetical protein VTJ83DRAFT_4 [Remersonia thermophila]|uniref:C2H2-type domain-containing protein n=1 Tax=Remersonia thermophila TaxID=72144 RepID=A0ABR4DJW0_9PEZI
MLAGLGRPWTNLAGQCALVRVAAATNTDSNGPATSASWARPETWASKKLEIRYVNQTAHDLQLPHSFSCSPTGSRLRDRRLSASQTEACGGKAPLALQSSARCAHHSCVPKACNVRPILLPSATERLSRDHARPPCTSPWGDFDVMAAIPIQASSRGGYGGRDLNASPLPSISSGHGDPLPRPFGILSRGYHADNLSPSAASTPLPIRNSDMNDVPPPLPPPRLVPIKGPVDPNVQNSERFRRPDDCSGIETDSLGHSFRRPELSFRVGAPDDGYHSFESTRLSSFPSPLGPQAMNSYHNPGDSIDHSMLERLNRSTRRPGLSASVNDPPPPRLHHAQPTTLSLPNRSRQPFDSFAKSPGPLSATSPVNPPFGHHVRGSVDYRSPVRTDGPGAFDRSPLPRTHRLQGGGTGPDDAPLFGYGGYDARDDEVDFPMDETSRMRSLAIDDHGRERDWDRDRDRDRDRERDGYQPGQKRRASSPPSEDAALASDMGRKRDGYPISRASPAPRLLMIPQNSVSSLSSASRSGSYTSNLTASSITSLGSYGRRSPNPLSPGGLSPTDHMACSSPFPPSSQCASPRSTLARSASGLSPHSRTPSEQPLPPQVTRTVVSPRKVAEIPKSHSNLAARLKGPYMCECCPKKPKKFETEEDLRAHEAEKQYECSFCGNRFKNKNEAERHQNSLHVRRHSWSCAALKNYDRAFHESTARPGEADVCGYCGEEFLRTGRSQDGTPSISELDMEGRIRHLQDAHKFGECNPTKKFYRADHFRQHLKHSHAGTSGKWTNMLENACMIEEEPVTSR